MTTEVLRQLRAMQQAISRQNGSLELTDTPRFLFTDADTEKLYFSEVEGLLHVEFYASPFNEKFNDFLELLTNADVAASLRSLVFRGPDEGANGTRNWDFTRLIDSDVVFPNLTSLFIEPTAPDHHNQTIIGAVYEEDGQIAQFLSKTPALQSLTIPNAPNEAFFNAGERPLAFLRVDTGYNHQNFIRNLGESSYFPGLRTLDFGDYDQRFMEDYPTACVPFEDYAYLFQSPAFASVGRFVLRNVPLSAEQLAALRRLTEAQFFVIQLHGEYVRP